MLIISIMLDCIHADLIQKIKLFDICNNSAFLNILRLLKNSLKNVTISCAASGVFWILSDYILGIKKKRKMKGTSRIFHITIPIVSETC